LFFVPGAIPNDSMPNIDSKAMLALYIGLWFSAPIVRLRAFREGDNLLSIEAGGGGTFAGIAPIPDSNRTWAERGNSSLLGVNPNFNKCDKTDITGCIACDGKRSITLTRNLHSKKPYSQYTLVAQDGGIARVKLPIMSSKERGFASSRNCFAFATHQNYQVPGNHPTIVAARGNSPVHEVNEISAATLEQAMELEGAIWLGRNSDHFKQLELGQKVVTETVYYLVAALVTPEEYHFWGLWNNGWYSVTSKTSGIPKDVGTYQNVGLRCPGHELFTEFWKEGYYSDQGGFYLFPCRGTGSDGLSGNNECWK